MSIKPNVEVTTKIYGNRSTISGGQSMPERKLHKGDPNELLSVLRMRPLVTKNGKTGKIAKKTKKIAPRIFLKAGESVRIFVKYAGQFDYSYASFIRGPNKGVFHYSGDSHLLFPQLSQDWKIQMAENIKRVLTPMFEKDLIHRDDLYGDFKRWEVSLIFSCQFSDIQIRNPDDVCMASDDQKIIY